MWAFTTRGAPRACQKKTRLGAGNPSLLRLCSVLAMQRQNTVVSTAKSIIRFEHGFTQGCMMASLGNGGAVVRCSVSNDGLLLRRIH